MTYKHMDRALWMLGFLTAVRILRRDYSMGLLRLRRIFSQPVYMYGKHSKPQGMASKMSGDTPDLSAKLNGGILGRDG